MTKFSPSLNDQVAYAIFGCKPEKQHLWDAFIAEAKDASVLEILTLAKGIADKVNADFADVGEWKPATYWGTPTAVTNTQDGWMYAVPHKGEYGITLARDSAEVVVLGEQK